MDGGMTVYGIHGHTHALTQPDTDSRSEEPPVT